jgi:hypothetical protein
MTGQVLPFPRDLLERRALRVLHARHKPLNGGYSAKEIEWALVVVRQMNPNHPLLDEHHDSSEEAKVIL